MSMNLHCEETELWQTPTYISYMCYSNEDGGWKGIYYRYKKWVNNHTNGVWDNEEALEYKRSLVKDHLDCLEWCISNYGKLTFSIR